MDKNKTPNLRLDFRSDTLTQPSAAMREAMANAPVGDDVFSEDPSVNHLEEKLARMFGHEAGLFCSSGTMTNQVAIQVHCRPGDEVICAKDAHIYKYEGGGIARNAGASVHLIEGDRGRISAQDVISAIHQDDVHYPTSKLVSVEDTMNRGGGCTYSFDSLVEIRSVCDKHNIPLHVDGARLFNSLAATGTTPGVYGPLFDSISICLSKGLGAPVGSILLGNRDFIHNARRVRKVMGGGMRQAGILAAGGIFALNHQLDRLSEDHRRAYLLSKGLEKLDFVESVLPVETNIVVATVSPKTDLQSLVTHCDQKGLRIIAFSENSFRLVTHLHNDDDSVDEAVKIISSYS